MKVRGGGGGEPAHRQISGLIIQRHRTELSGSEPPYRPLVFQETLFPSKMEEEWRWTGERVGRQGPQRPSLAELRERGSKSEF